MRHEPPNRGHGSCRSSVNESSPRSLHILSALSERIIFLILAIPCPVCWVGAGFDYVHYHVPKPGLDEIARDHGIEPTGSYKFAICEHDIVLAQLTQYVLPLIGSRDWTGSLALDQFSLILDAHVLKTYAGIPPLGAAKRGGLAPRQGKRAAEMMRENPFVRHGARVRPVGESFYTRIPEEFRYVALSLASGTQD
jgi:hypothetical protein